VWPGEHEELTVWADRLLTDGEPLGQLVALGLRVEQLRHSGADPRDVDALFEELAEMIERNAEALLGPLASEPKLELEWQYGVVRALTLGDQTSTSWSELCDGLAELVQRPVMRFLDHLHIVNTIDPPAELQLLELLAHPSSVIRPRRIIFGAMPKRFRLLRPLEDRHRMSKLLFNRYAKPVRELIQRGLTWMILQHVNLALPWTTGEASERVRALEQLLASPWTPQHTPLLGCALWDTSLRVRRRVIEAIPTLPDEAAPLLLPLLAINVDGHHLFSELVQRAVAHAATRPAWVHAVAQNYRDCEPWVANWLATIKAPAC
jgi:hypothetical protein